MVFVSEFSIFKGCSDVSIRQVLDDVSKALFYFGVYSHFSSNRWLLLHYDLSVSSPLHDTSPESFLVWEPSPFW